MATGGKPACGNQRALFTLHVGQSALIAVGVAAIMLLAGQDVMARRMSVGDLVLINAYALQVCLPLNALGFVYREARDAWVNAERLFALLRERPRSSTRPACRACAPGGARSCSTRQLPLRSGAAGAARRQPSHRPRHHAGRGRAQRLGQVDPGAPAAALLRPGRGRILIDGQDIRASPASVRARSAWCRRNGLFNDTIGNNIAYGRIGSRPRRVVAAAAPPTCTS
jgi:ATP-binding cassette subfamily B protein